MSNRFEIAARKEFSKIAGEPIETRLIDGTIYGFGSELGTLRLFKKYQGARDLHHGFSTLKNAFYFSYGVNI